MKMLIEAVVVIAIILFLASLWGTVSVEVNGETYNLRIRVQEQKK